MFPVEKGRVITESSQRLPLFQNTVKRLYEALSFHVAPSRTDLDNVPVALTTVTTLG